MSSEKTPYQKLDDAEIARRVRRMLRLMPSRTITSMARHLEISGDKLRKVMLANGIVVRREPAMSGICEKIRFNTPADIAFNRKSRMRPSETFSEGRPEATGMVDRMRLRMQQSEHA